MRTTAAPRVLAVLSAAALAAGLLLMMSSPATASSRQNPQSLPSPLDSLIPSSLPSASGSPKASPSETTAPGENDTSVLGQTIPKTGASRALPLLIGGVSLAATSVALRRVLVRRT